MFGGFTDFFVISIHSAPLEEQDMNCPAMCVCMGMCICEKLHYGLSWKKMADGFPRSFTLLNCKDSKISLYQTVVIDSSVYNLNQALLCKVQIHDATLQ